VGFFDKIDMIINSFNQLFKKTVYQVFPHVDTSRSSLHTRSRQDTAIVTTTTTTPALLLLF